MGPKAGTLRSSESNSGCALGMAAVAHGCIFGPVGKVPDNDRRTVNVEKIWGAWLLRVVMRPCECSRIARPMRVKDIIAHLFDCHVMKKHNWTLEELAAWVARWEPEEVDPAIIRRALERQSTDPKQLAAEAEEWRRTRESFELRQMSKRRRSHV